MAAFGWSEQPKISRIIRLIYIVAKFSPNRDFTKHNGVTVRTFKHWKLRQKKPATMSPPNKNNGLAL